MQRETKIKSTNDPRRLFSAAFSGKVDKLRKLLEHEDAPDWGCLLDWKSEQGVTPLHAACQEGHRECVELLLDNNASVDSVAADSQDTPLMTACEFGRHSCVEILLKAGASLGNANATHHATALHIAARSGSARCTHLLLESKANTESADSSGNIALPPMV